MWEARWDMKFSPSTCQVEKVTRSRKLVKCIYRLHGHVLNTVTSAKYLGVDVSSDLTWNSHIDRNTSKVNKTLGFLQSNIKTKTVRETACNTLLRPQLEYPLSVWTPIQKSN